jgi:hypothetical protein
MCVEARMPAAIDGTAVKLAAVALAASVLCGCASKPMVQVSPVDMEGARQVCIVENPRVHKPEFLDAYRKALESKGYTVKVVAASSGLGICPVTAKYVAYWNWDLVLYMSSAELRVYKNGRPAGGARFWAGQKRLMNMEDEVKALVDQLYR